MRQYGQKVFIVSAKRTAIGKFLGSLYEADPAEVCAQVIPHLFPPHFDLAGLECVIVGNVVSAGMGQGPARRIAVAAGIPQSVPAYSVNMVCGSGMQAIRNGVNEIRCGAQAVLCGGVEFMSNIPYATNSYIRLGKKFGDFTMTDLMTHDGLLDAFSGVHMGITAENIAEKYHITRQQQDEYAWLAQQRAIRAVDGGIFKNEIVPVTLHDYRGREYVFDTDEFPNRTSTPEKLASLKPTFRKDGSGTVTAGNTSGINDGAAFVLLASGECCARHGLRPLAEVCESAAVGCDPQLMGLGPYYAIRRLLSEADMPFDAIDSFEINEAFAAQALGCYQLLAQEYGVAVQDIIDKCNPDGSGLGLGHPLGATGARLAVTLAHGLHRRGQAYGIASLCVGGGMGLALLLRKVGENETIEG